MKRIFILATCIVSLVACSDQEKDGSKTETSEFADAKYADIGKEMSDQFVKGNTDRWLEFYSDNAIFRWSSGDSLAGKEAISKYWKDRRLNVVDSVEFTDQIWLPIKVKTAQTTHDAPGVWLLNWYTVHVKYKNGKKLTYGVHIDHHFDTNDKVDQSILYFDRAPIVEALGKK